MLKKKKNKKEKIVTQPPLTEYQMLVRTAILEIFGDDFPNIDEQVRSEPRRYRIKFTFKPLKEFLERNPTLFDCTPEQKHERLVNYPFLEYLDDAQQDILKYNITSIENNDSKQWVVEYFNLNDETEQYIGTDIEVMDFFNMSVADLYYIAKTIIPKNKIRKNEK